MKLSLLGLALPLASCASTATSYMLPTDVGKQVLSSHRAKPLACAFVALDIGHVELFADALHAIAPEVRTSVLPARKIGLADQRKIDDPVADACLTEDLLHAHWRESAWLKALASAATNPFLTVEQPDLLFAVRVGTFGRNARSSMDMDGRVLVVSVDSIVLAPPPAGQAEALTECLDFVWQRPAPSALTADRLREHVAAAAGAFATKLSPFLNPPGPALQAPVSPACR